MISARKVTVVSNKYKKAKLTIPATVKNGKITYKVTGIAKKAFYKNKKIKQLTIGKNVSTIGSKAFYKAKKLNKVTFKTTKLSKKNVAKDAFKGISKKVKIKAPKAKKKLYRSFVK